MNKTQELYRRAKDLIPGGTQLLSKRPEQFLPGLWPAYYKKAKGCMVWDLDNNKYIDTSYMGIGATILGYADDEIDQKIIEVIKNGTFTTLNCPEEVELADLLLNLHPWAQMVRYARTGGEAMAVAIRIARAKTRKDKVIFCGYHGWHDWYLSANLADNEALNGHLLPGLAPYGVPRGLKGTSLPFRYNDTNEFLDLLEKHKNEIAAVVIEPVRSFEPEKTFLETIKSSTAQQNIVLIIDEVTAGWRLNIGGAHLIYNLEPDIAVFAKGISNGYAMAAIIGKRAIMDAAQDTFISSTYWTERIGPVAALAAITKMKRENVPSHLVTIGKKVKQIWLEEAQKANCAIHISGIDPIAHFDFSNAKPLECKTLFTQSMLEYGFLATTSFYASLAHTHEIVERYGEAVSKIFSLIAQTISLDDFHNKLKGSVCQAGFKRLT